MNSDGKVRKRLKLGRPLTRLDKIGLLNGAQRGAVTVAYYLKARLDSNDPDWSKVLSELSLLNQAGRLSQNTSTDGVVNAIMNLELVAKVAHGALAQSNSRGASQKALKIFSQLHAGTGHPGTVKLPAPPRTFS